MWDALKIPLKEGIKKVDPATDECERVRGRDFGKEALCLSHSGRRSGMVWVVGSFRMYLLLHSLSDVESLICER